MLVEEIISETLVKHYSNEGFKILQKETGLLYIEAIDIIPCKYTYEETNISIEESNSEGNNREDELGD